MTYDIQVKTLPEVFKKNIKIKEHTHNTIQIDAAQGFLNLTSKYSPYNVNYTTRISLKDNQNTINHQQLKSPQKYLVGKYTLEVFTLPRTYKEIEIKDKQTTTIDIPAAGTLDLRLKVPATGQIFVLRDDEKYEWVCNLNTKSTKQKWNLQPGKYKIIYRGKKQYSSSYTTGKSFTIKSNNTIYLTL
jgi:Ca-activated chloride channel family protein